jgi:hypothetical protein
MRWKILGVCLLSLAGGLGCPHAFGRGGTIDKAMHKDLMEQLKNGPCSERDRRRYCSVGQDLEECFLRCE